MSSRFLNFLTIPIAKKSAYAYMTAISLFVALALPMRLTAQAQYEVVDMGIFGGPQGQPQHHHYKLIEVGRKSYINGFDYYGPVQNLNAAGTLIGWADTDTPDPYC